MQSFTHLQAQEESEPFRKLDVYPSSSYIAQAVFENL